MPWRKELYSRLNPPVARQIHLLGQKEAEEIEEIRIRINRPMELVSGKKRWMLGYTPGEPEMMELIAALCGYARYAHEKQLAEGYIPLPGGHRAGVCGRVVLQNGENLRMSDVTSVCIRIARNVQDASGDVRSYLIGKSGRPARVLFIGPPGCGKTTLLKDAALYLSDQCGFHVAVADEREELFPGNTHGVKMDVLPGIKKSLAMPMLIRSMAPEVIVTDEIGDLADVSAVLDAARCGIGLLCSAHADGLHSAARRPVLREMMDSGAFDRCIQLGRHGICVGVWEYEEGGLPATGG